MLNYIGKAGIAAIALVLAGCATLSTEECQRGDWHAIGQTDGAAGLPMSQIDKHTRACRKAGVAPNVATYSAGRQAGLAQFCTYGSGVTEGANNRDYKRVCTGSAEANFLDGYESGQKIYRLNQRIAQINTNINDTRELLYADNLNDDDRYRLQSILDGLEDQHTDLRVELRLYLEKNKITLTR
ncbi:MAG: DUF2799 domain-containing protein [Alphaproteobacteria bacterium]